MPRKRGKKLEEGVVPEPDEEGAVDFEELLDSGVPDVKPWLVQPWNRELIDMWKTGPDAKEFLAHAEAMGFEIATDEDVIKTTMKDIPEGGLDLNSQTEVIAEVLSRVLASQKMATVAPTKQQDAPADWEWVDFPEPKSIELDDGTISELPLYPINLGGQDYNESGMYRPEVAKRLRDELSEAREVNVPNNAAFVEYTFFRKDEDGKSRRIRERFVGKVFACKTLADSLEAQIESLVTFDVPHGEMPGTQTKYDDLVTNNIRFVTGYQYLVPPNAKADLQRRIREHEVAFQNLHKERTNLAITGDPRSSDFRGHEVGAKEALARQAQGLDPSEVINNIPPGDLR
jgi:hypothetical protein